MWGTSKSGTIPQKLLREDGAASAGVFSLAGDEKVVDHPVRLELGDVDDFLFGEEGGKGRDGGGRSSDVLIQRIDCGASGTAVVLDDGRCFVMGSNKNGELG